MLKTPAPLALRFFTRLLFFFEYSCIATYLLFKRFLSSRIFTISCHEFGTGFEYNGVIPKSLRADRDLIPLPITVVLFSNIESVSGHEIGHHQDYQRFDSDWKYGLAGFLYPVKLHKEWQASQNSKKLLSAEDQWQFNRFLLPAFLTYLIGGFYVSRKLLQRSALESYRDNRDIDELEEYEKPEIQPIQTLRHFGTII